MSKISPASRWDDLRFDYPTQQLLLAVPRSLRRLGWLESWSDRHGAVVAPDEFIPRKLKRRETLDADSNPRMEICGWSPGVYFRVLGVSRDRDGGRDWIIGGVWLRLMADGSRLDSRVDPIVVADGLGSLGSHVSNVAGEKLVAAFLEVKEAADQDHYLPSRRDEYKIANGSYSIDVGLDAGGHGYFVKLLAEKNDNGAGCVSPGSAWLSEMPNQLQPKLTRDPRQIL